VTELGKLTESANILDKVSKKYISNLIRKDSFSGKAEQSLLIHNVPGCLAERVLLIGCGKEKVIDGVRFRSIVDNTVKAIQHNNIHETVNCLTELNVKDRDLQWKIRQTVEIVSHRLYEFAEFKTDKSKKRKRLKKMVLTIPSKRELAESEATMAKGKAIAAGVKLTRDLANRPSNICTPSYLVEQAKKLEKEKKVLKVKALDEAAMEKLAMNSLLSVSQGAVEPAKLITIEYRGAAKDTKPYVLVGKGITFDAGGISLKPSAAMDEMKYDMCGAASVIGTMSVVADLKLPINVVAVVPATENVPSGTATKPGDIFTSMSGQTIEVLNTDAEGRLILCDAITYAQRYNPTAVIDVATLTGACVIALGKHATGMLSNNDALAKQIFSAGEDCGDRAWQLPLWDEYDKQLESPFADMANIGGRDAGTITAACFLSRFAKKLNWAHLDIAGTAWISEKKKGATGRPVSLLVQYLMDRC